MHSLKYDISEVHAELFVSHYQKATIKLLREAHCIIANIDKHNLLHIRYIGDKDTRINYDFFYHYLHDLSHHNPTLTYGCITQDDMFIINNGISFSTYRYIPIPFLTLLRLLVLVGAMRLDHGKIDCMSQHYTVTKEGIHLHIDKSWYDELTHAVREEKDSVKLARMALSPLQSALSSLHDGKRIVEILSALAKEAQTNYEEGLRDFSEDGIKRRLLNQATRLYHGYGSDPANA